MSDKQCTIIEKIQKHIYAHPFYNWCGENVDTMDVLVVGDGLYASKFVDLCLQTGQMLDKELVIYWCIKDDATKATFLTERPAYSQFVSIDGNAATKESYGTLYFKSMDQMYDAFALDCRYIFAACEDDTDNAEIVNLIKGAGNDDVACLAAYLEADEIKVILSEGTHAPELIEQEEADQRMLISIQNSADEYLYRMAFNTHRIWEGIGNPDYDNIKKHFEDPYNRNSSVSFVLSIPYKLKSVGIHETNPYVAAYMLDEILKKAEKKSSSKEAKILSQLAALEHRRWVLEKIADGISDLPGAVPRKYVECVERKNVKFKNKKGKLVGHPCVVTSTEKTPLINGPFKDHALWDDPKADLSQLDELDTVSIMLHRAMKAEADKLKEKQKRDQLFAKIDALARLCQFDAIAKRNCDRYRFCIKNMLDSSKSYATQFGTYEKMLRQSIDQNPAWKEREEAQELVNQIGGMLFAVLECNQYRDYKSYDIDFIKYIPFILTGVSDIHLCMPLGEASNMRNNNDDYFASVASATALFAKRITYLYVYEYTTNLDILASKLKAIRNYFDYRGKRCHINLEVFFDTNEYGTKAAMSLEKVFIHAKKEGYIQGYHFTNYTCAEELTPQIMDVMSVFDEKVDFFDGINPLTRSADINSSVISAITSKYLYFEFDSYNKKFRNCKSCSYLNYLRLSSFIQVEDMFALMNAQDAEFNYQDYADVYEIFWKIYSGEGIRNCSFPLAARSWNEVVSVMQTVKVHDGTDGKSHCVVTCAKLSADPAELRVAKEMLKRLEGTKIIKDLVIDEDSNEVSLKLTDRRFKNILTKAGDVLEAYVYFEACKLNWFDDVQTGYKFKWEYDNVTNELDCVLTKGYRSILVECKSKKNVEEGFYLTLDSIGDHFGIGYKKVLVLVTETDKKGYDQYVSRGKQMGIITISKKEDLDRIGEILKEIMEDE